MSADFTSVRDVSPSPNGRRFTVWSVALPLVAVAAGFLVVSGASTANGTDLRAERRTQLTDLISAREAQVGQRAGNVSELQREVDALVADRAAAPPPAPGMNTLAAQAGTTEMSGPGLSVSLDDAPRSIRDSLPEGVRPDDLVVHQQDVQAVVNALWSAGAEGMRIMDQRVISTSAVRCVGNTLVLQGRVYGPPFRISAVGDASSMRAALDASPELSAYRTWVDAVGLGYDVVDEKTLTLPAFSGSLDLSYARSAS